MKTGLILEGGAMRGMYTAGVLDVMMENNIWVDGAVGVSAGAVFGCNYKSKQIGRTIRYNKKYGRDPRYAGFHSLLKTGDYFGTEFCYHEIPEKLDPFDTETFEKNPVEFYVVGTDVTTGKAVYHKCTNGKDKDLEWFRASASMPLLSNIVEVDGYRLLDGGIADSIPLVHAMEKGYRKNVVVLTRNKGYRKKKPGKSAALYLAAFRQYPDFLNTLYNRYRNYNRTLELLEKWEQEGHIFVIRPQEPAVGRAEANKEKLLGFYQHGYDVMKANYEELVAYLYR